MDTLTRMISADGMITAAAVSGRDLVERARQIHGLSPVATAALGRALIAASMMGDELKEVDGTVTLRLQGGGPIGTVLAVADSGGNPRGCVGNPDVPLMEHRPGKLDVGAAVGTDGTLTVIRDMGLKDPWVGSVNLVSGEVAEDVTRYYAESAQTPTACALGVLVGTDCSVASAGGYLIQFLPGADESAATAVEQGIDGLGPVSAALESGMSPEDMIRKVLDEFDMQLVETHPVEYKCPCTRERVETALIGLGPAELRDMIREQHGAQVTCRFCDAVYEFSGEDLEKMASDLETDRVPPDRVPPDRDEPDPETED